MKQEVCNIVHVYLFYLIKGGNGMMNQTHSNSMNLPFIPHMLKQGRNLYSQISFFKLVMLGYCCKGMLVLPLL